MANQTLAGTPIPRNSAPLVTRGVPNGNGLYPWSVIDATLVTYDPTQSPAFAVTSVSDANEGIQLLLFTSDVPIFVDATQLITTQAWLGTVRQVPTPYTVAMDGAAVFAELKTTSTSTVAVTFTPGVPGVGYVRGVACSGFAAAGTLSTFDLVTLSGGTITVSREVTIRTIANGAVVNGSPLVNTATDFVPVILLAANYTQAILDAGNTFTASAKTYQVVGLYDLV